MSAHLAPDQEGDNTTELTNSPGRRLRVARQTRGLELEGIASELHLSPAMIKHLEHDEYDALPGEVFIVGYLRKYARAVGLDPEPLVAAYHQASPETTRTWRRPRATPRRSAPTPRAGSGHQVVRLIGIGIPLVLAAIVFNWWQRQESSQEVATGETAEEQDAALAGHPGSDAQKQTPTPPDAPVVVAKPRPLDVQIQERSPPPPGDPAPEIADQQPAPDAVEDSPPVAEAAGVGAETTDHGAAEGEAAAPLTGDDVAASTQSQEIVMTFDGPCWVDVRDSERKYKLFGEMKKGDSHVLEGTPPYSVILGNAASVKITVGGAEFDLSAISQGNVARFTLDPKELP